MEKKNTNSKLDKIIMGAIIGSAIGSVLGVALAPKSGKETRKIIAEKSKDVYNKGKIAGQTSKSFIKRILEKFKTTHSEDEREVKGIKKIPIESSEIKVEKDLKIEK